jgi:glycosyl-4,4'-diaponeurosporenoate acyltransferase
MLIELPEIWIVVIDFVLWFTIHLSIAYIGTILPARYINIQSALFRKRVWENDGLIYEKVFFIKKWKEILPDGSALFKKGFRKKRISSLNAEYLNLFIIEVCRAEAVHWIVILFSPVFFIWNYWWAGIIMIVYAFVANLPCIFAQRYNRIRLYRLVVEIQK